MVEGRAVQVRSFSDLGKGFRGSAPQFHVIHEA